MKRFAFYLEASVYILTTTEISNFGQHKRKKATTFRIPTLSLFNIALQLPFRRGSEWTKYVK